ncbi:MAG: carbon-nitrogen hydrolase family protein [Phycisphaeraceae bacterium]|nr:carbon-nitrogen hydrolase family protein [Phycisphaeraceae bacterium]
MKTKVAVVQVGSVMFDAAGGLAKAVEWLKQAAQTGAKLVVFPETFIPCYPRGLGFGTVVGTRQPHGRQLWQRFLEQAVVVPGPITEALGKAAREAGVYLAIGVTERDQQFSGTTLYCTLLYFGPDGTLLGKHRKLKPTAAERLIWGEGDGSTLPVIETPFGRMGGLLCWENLMPLARMAMYAKGVGVYLAPTADFRQPWQATLQHIAYEGRCYVLGCNQYVTRAMYPADLRDTDVLANLPEEISSGGSAIISPLGEYLAGPLFGSEGILTAEVDPAEVIQARFDFDVAGHYSRPDVFQFSVNESAQRPAHLR